MKSITTLENGLKIVTDYIDHVETVSLGAWFGVGARYEDTALNGISHVLEHMAFKGTEKRSAFDISMAIEAVGGYLNAYTSRETTAYYARVLKDDVFLATDILSDILQFSTFDKAELEKEKQVILQEIGQTLDTPDDIIFDYFQETCFPNQPLGRSILGPQDNVKRFTREEVTGYMQKNYSTHNVVFAAAGKVEHEKFVQEIKGKIISLSEKKGTTQEDSFYKGGDFRLEKELEQVHLVMGFKGLQYGHEQYYDQMLLSVLLGGGMSSRLFQEIREKRGLVYTISTFVAPYADNGVFGIYAGTSENDAKELIPTVLSELSKVLDHINVDELKRCKAQLRASLLMGLENTTSRCERLANQMLIHGRLIENDEIEQKIEQVTVEKIQNYLSEMLKSLPTIAALGPVSKVMSYDDFKEKCNNIG